MDLHPGEEIVFEGHPSWRGVLSFYLKGLAIALALGAILLFAVSTGIGILAFAIVMALVIVAGLVKRMATRYVISTERLNIRTGILSKHVQQTNIDRVQNVNTEQTLRVVQPVVAAIPARDRLSCDVRKRPPRAGLHAHRTERGAAHGVVGPNDRAAERVDHGALVPFNVQLGSGRGTSRWLRCPRPTESRVRAHQSR